jgi:hypothetical protein
MVVSRPYLGSKRPEKFINKGAVNTNYFNYINYINRAEGLFERDPLLIK